MKRIQVIIICIMLLAGCSTYTYAAGPSKSERRIAYTLKNLKLNQQQQKAIKPLLVSYLEDMKEAKKQHKALEKKYENAINTGTLTDAQAKALLQAKFDSDVKETAVKKNYLPKFTAAIPAKKVFLLYDFINDKMSKVDGTKKSKSADEDDDE